MTGTIINAVCIILGGIIGACASNWLTERGQNRIKLLLCIATLYVATEMLWTGVHGSFFHCLAQMGIGMLSLVLGNMMGMALRLQKGLNQLGQIAKRHMAKSGEGGSKFNEGFITCTILFCVGPMAIIGAMEDGLNGNFKILAVKGCMDGLATIGFTAMFGWGSALSVIPVVAYQGSISLAADLLDPVLNDAMKDSIRVTGGLLVYTITVILLDLCKVPLANYLPALAVAPLLTWWWM